MSIVKSYSVGNGDMFCINHEPNIFTTIDCCLNTKEGSAILDKITSEFMGKKLCFISTHPDEDHIRGLSKYINAFPMGFFFCVKNNLTNVSISDDFYAYCHLRNIATGFLDREVTLEFPNELDNVEERIKCLWSNKDYSGSQNELNKNAKSKNLNNLSPIITYTAPNGATFMWMGDLQHDFLEGIKEDINWSHVDILFAPHHGRDSGGVPLDVLRRINPQIIVLGDAPSENLHYDYKKDGFNTITQNSAGDITFECVDKLVNVYVENKNYKVTFLNKVRKYQRTPSYLGSISI